MTHTQPDAHVTTKSPLRCDFYLSAPGARWDLTREPPLALQGMDIRARLGANPSELTLSGGLQIGGVTTALDLKFDKGSNVSGSIRSVEGVELTALVEWLGGKSLAESVRSGFSSMGLEVRPTMAAIQVDWSERELTAMELAGKLTFFALPLQAVVRLRPDLIVTGNLESGKDVSVADVLSALKMSVAGLSGNTRIEAADFTAHPSTADYKLKLKLAGTWPAGPLSLTDPSLVISHDPAGGTVATIEAVLSIGGSKQAMQGSYSRETGWWFRSVNQPGTAVAMSDLIAVLSGPFHVQDVPAPIKDLHLTGINVEYQEHTGRFSFTGKGDLPVGENRIDLEVGIDLAPRVQGGFQTTFGGKVAFNGLAFDLLFDTKNPALGIFAAIYPPSGKRSSVKLADLVAPVSGKLAKEIPANVAIDLKAAKFISLKQNGTRQFAFALDLGNDISLADLPLVGSQLPADQTLAVHNLQFGYSSAALKRDQAKQVNELLAESGLRLPDADLPQGMLLAADLQLGTESKQLAMSGDDGAGEPGSPDEGATGEGPTDCRLSKWFDVQKQFGVFQFNRIGVEYEHNTLRFGLDVALTLGPLTFTLDGLTCGSPLDHFEPAFGLKGLGVTYRQEPLELTGGLLRVDDGKALTAGAPFQFDGMLAVQAKEINLAAIGSYAKPAKGDPSLFVYARLEKPLGGPPAFFVTGLMAGFGFNRAIRAMTAGEVMSFPLLLMAQNPPSGRPPTAMEVLNILEGRGPDVKSGTGKAWIVPKPGEYWLAVGLMWTSFQLITSKALLIGEFGHQLQARLLGVSTLRLPKGAAKERTYVYAELGLEGVFRPQEGVFAMTAILGPKSYVFDPDCRLTGGFAFAMWYGDNPNAGQFVFTMGGYHPNFKVPAYYPSVPRLRFNWAVSDHVTIKGAAYLAITPSLAMAGGSLEVLFHAGDLKAWFTAQADLLVAWQPFFFLAKIHVSVGVSYRVDLWLCSKTIEASVGATMEMWGPPTGGKVRVELWVISFTIPFGSKQGDGQNKALNWGEFEGLLPDRDDRCKIAVTAGLYKTMESSNSSSKQAWVVRAGAFRFYTQSAVPASQIKYGAAGKHGFADGTAGINIRPMNLTGVTSTHTLRVCRDNPDGEPVDTTGWTLTARKQNLPASLWGAPPKSFTQIPDRPSADIVSDRLVGYQVAAPEPTIGHTRAAMPLSRFAKELITPPGRMPVAPAVTRSSDYRPRFDAGTVAQISKIADDHVQQQRAALCAALSGAGVYSGKSGSLSSMAACAGHIFTDVPLQQA